MFIEKNLMLANFKLDNTTTIWSLATIALVVVDVKLV